MNLWSDACVRTFECAGRGYDFISFVKCWLNDLCEQRYVIIKFNPICQSSNALEFCASITPVDWMGTVSEPEATSGLWSPYSIDAISMNESRFTMNCSHMSFGTLCIGYACIHPPPSINAKSEFRSCPCTGHCQALSALQLLKIMKILLGHGPLDYGIRIRI